MRRPLRLNKATTLLVALCASVLAAACAAPPAPVSEPAPIGSRIETGRDLSVRSAIVAPNAAAATAHPLATQIALDVMKEGGSALDAAIAANAFLGLAEPTNGSIGGDLFALVWDPEAEELFGYNGSGRSAQGATLTSMQQIARDAGDAAILPAYGEATVSVAGTVDGWFALHGRFGKLPMSRLLSPAIAYAESGAPILEVVAHEWGQQETWLSAAAESGDITDFEPARALFFSPKPAEGDLFRNTDLAATYRLLAARGRDAFYKGEIARAVDAHMRRTGGALRYEDFANHTGEWVEPICADYRRARLCEIGPNTQGVAALQMLQMIAPYNVSEMGFGSADAIMLGVEAKRLAFADRARLYADPGFTGFDAQALIDPDYAAARASTIELSDAMPAPAPGFSGADSALSRGDTTYISVADSSGMMVSLIQSNYFGMGSGVVVPGAGFMLQNRGRLFSFDPNHPNRFEPGKRPFQTIIPAFAFHKDASGELVPWLSFGVMGGDMQPQGHAQILMNLLDFGMGLQEAGDAARWRHTGDCQPTDSAADTDPCFSGVGTLFVEPGIPVSVREELSARGYDVQVRRSRFGGYQAVMRELERGVWIAATEMRKDGAADGF